MTSSDADVRICLLQSRADKERPLYIACRVLDRGKEGREGELTVSKEYIAGCTRVYQQCGVHNWIVVLNWLSVRV